MFVQAYAHRGRSLRGFVETGEEVFGETVDFFGDRLLASVVYLGRADIGPGSQYMVAFADLFDRRRVAESGEVLIFELSLAGAGSAAPGVVGAGDPGE